MEYLSKEGYDKIVAELDNLMNVEFPKVKEALAEARAQGDLSENFEYRATKRTHSRMIGRINFLQKVLKFARVIDTSKLAKDQVTLLSKVGLTNLDNGAQMTYTLVSPHEMNLKEGKISIKSPIGQALMGKKAGDEVLVKAPAMTLRLRIDSVVLDA